MKPWVVNAIKSLIQERIGELERLEISWFGGEPLIAKDIVLEISNYIVKLSSENNLQVNYDSNITTNAFYLDFETYEKLVSAGIKEFQITLDGPKEIHNLSRKQVNGEGTFDKIWSNLLEIKNSDKKANIILRIHYSLENFDFLSDLIVDLDDAFGSDERFSFYFKTIDKLGGENDDALQTVPYHQKDLYKEILKRNTKSKGRLFELTDALPYVCYASKPNSIGIRSDGSLVKCTVGLDYEDNNIGVINLDGTLTVNNDNLKKWIIGFEKFDLSVLACPYFKMTGIGELK